MNICLLIPNILRIFNPHMLILMFTLTETHRVHSFTQYSTMSAKFEFRTIISHWATLVQTTASLCGHNLGVARTVETSCIAVVNDTELNTNTVVTLPFLEKCLHVLKHHCHNATKPTSWLPSSTQPTGLHTFSRGCTSKHVHRQSLPFPCWTPRMKYQTQWTSWMPSSLSLQLNEGFYTQRLLHTEAFTTDAFTHSCTHRRIYTDTFTHKHFYTHAFAQKLLHTDAFTQTLLHTDPLAHKYFQTQKRLHTDSFTDRHFDTQMLLHTGTSTQRHFYTQTLLHTEAFDSFTHRLFYRNESVAIDHSKSQFFLSFWRPTSISCESVAMDAKSQFFLSFWRPTSMSCERVAPWHLKVAIFLQFLTSNVHFVRKGCRGRFKVACFLQFLTSNVHFVRKGCDGRFKIAILPRFLTSNVHFVRKGCARHLKVALFPQFLTSNVHFVRKGCARHLKIAILPRFWTSKIRTCEGMKM